MNIIITMLMLIASIKEQTTNVIQQPDKVRAIHYNVGKMEQVIANRLNKFGKHYTKGFFKKYNVKGYVAVPPCSLLGQTVEVSFQDGWSKTWSEIEPYQVVDCTKQEDLAYHYAHNIGIETDGYTAQRYHFYLGEGGDGWTNARIYEYLP